VCSISLDDKKIPLELGQENSTRGFGWKQKPHKFKLSDVLQLIMSNCFLAGYFISEIWK
jgi:hypothetical protein